MQVTDPNVSKTVSDHVVIFRDISSAEIVSSGCVDAETIGGLRLAIRYDNATNTTSVNGIPVIDLDITGEYGIFHGIDGVLIEGDSDYRPCTDFSPIVEAGNYGTLLDAIAQTKVDDFIGRFAPVSKSQPL